MLLGSGFQGSGSWGADARLWSMYVIWGERGWRCRVSRGSGILGWTRPSQRTACMLELRWGDKSVAEVLTEKATEGQEGRREARTSYIRGHQCINVWLSSFSPSWPTIIPGRSSYSRSWQTFSVKSQTVNILDLQAIVSVETTQLCHWSVKAATIDTKMNKHACALRKLSSWHWNSTYMSWKIIFLFTFLNHLKMYRKATINKNRTYVSAKMWKHWNLWALLVRV